ncbi:unnamed protein product [Anisakis simplex]|uniref:3'(2'),5'-bisphosphate nucleotidase 1 n=1 Tax=Anisakis simplex TaxID=6269 RepID=A0A0M3JS26_ANISI|nr:unnamed protein product [Anisakis simplex]
MSRYQNDLKAADELNTTTTNNNTDTMWSRACFLTRLVACSVRVSETAGRVIKDIMRNGDLKIVDKGHGGKEDFQTEADRSAQYCIIKSLQNKFGSQLTVIGEEEVVSAVPYIDASYSKEVLKFDEKCSKELREIDVNDVVVWVDPLDGTCEFAQANKNGSPLLQQVTVLIGISYKGRSVAGVIHQPYWGEKQGGRTIWGIVGVGTHGIDIVRDRTERVVVTTRSHSTTTVADALEALKRNGLADEVQPVGGAGYKVIRCLEGAAAYVFASAGCKKWDTAAPEAVIIAAGGKLTDVTGRQLYYGADAQINNTGGVLATSSWVNHQPCYICAAAWKFRQHNNVINREEEAKLSEDDEKCCISSVIHDIEETLKKMNPDEWTNKAINIDQLQLDTQQFVNRTSSSRTSVNQLKKQLDVLNEKWSKYALQRDFNKWAALRHWLHIPGLMRRIKMIQKDLRNGRQTSRNKRLKERIDNAENTLYGIKSRIRHLYAIYHRESKSKSPVAHFKKQLQLAVQRRRQTPTLSHRYRLTPSPNSISSSTYQHIPRSSSTYSSRNSFMNARY